MRLPTMTALLLSAGLGTFKPKPVAERTRLNPQTGEPMTVPAHTKVVFKPAAGLRWWAA